MLNRIQAVLANGGRVAIVGAPRTGKSTLARQAANEVPLMCTDPICLVKDPEHGVEYVPDSKREWSEASKYVAWEFLTRPGPWVLEGVGVARALRKFLATHPQAPPPVELLVHVTRGPFVPHLPGQASMGEGIQTVLDEIEAWVKPVLVTLPS